MDTADHVATGTRTPPPGGSPGRGLRVLGWVLRLALAAVFAAAGLSKLAGEQAQVSLFDAVGAGQWLRYLVGACEVAGAVGLLVPGLSVVAALALALLMVGATLTNVVVLGYSPALTLALLALLLVLAQLQRRVRSAGPGALVRARTPTT